MGCAPSVPYEPLNKPKHIKPFNRGDKVKVLNAGGSKLNDGARLGWIVLVVDFEQGLYAVQYDSDGGAELYEPMVNGDNLELVCARDWAIGGRGIEGTEFRCGTTVMAQTEFGRYSGIVTRRNDDGTFAVQTDFGDFFPSLDADILDAFD